MARKNAQVSSPGLQQHESVKRHKKPSVTGGAVVKGASLRKVTARRSTRATIIRQPVERQTDKLCEYCQKPLGSEYRPTKRFCSDKCRKEARLDRDNFEGKRRTAVGYEEGVCWVCGKTGLNGRKKHVHHVVGRDNAPEPLVVLCTGCHALVTELGRRVFLEDVEKVEDMITLARFSKGLPNVRTIVKFEEVE